jgi:hypothetical protein
MAVAIGFSLLAFAVPAGANPKAKTGEALLQYCTATIGAYVNFCYGYIDAVIDNLSASQAAVPLACVADETDEVALKNVVVEFLRKNEPLRATGAPELVVRALAAAYPCHKPE